VSLLHLHEKHRYLPWQTLLSTQSGIPPLSLVESEHEFLTRHERDIHVRRVWDIDSLMARLESLAVHRQGFKLSLTASWTRRVAQPHYFTIDGWEVYKKKHVLFGSGIAAQGSHLFTYIIFPYMPLDSDVTQLSDSQQEFWFDRIVLPSLHAVARPDEIHHYPHSFEDAKRRAYATQERVIKGTRQPINLEVFLPEAKLAPVWEEMLRRIHDPIRTRAPDEAQFRAYQDPVIFVSGHGLKLLFKGETLAHVRTEIIGALDIYFHRDRLHGDEVWLDFGIEDVPETPPNSPDRGTYLKFILVNSLKTGNLVIGSDHPF
jgi:hypothetical protein